MSEERQTQTDRVTMRTLNDGLNLVRQETKTELANVKGENKADHVKTRWMIAGLALTNLAKAASILGIIHFGGIPWLS